MSKNDGKFHITVPGFCRETLFSVSVHQDQTASYVQSDLNQCCQLQNVTATGGYSYKRREPSGGMRQSRNGAWLPQGVIIDFNFLCVMWLSFLIPVFFV